MYFTYWTPMQSSEVFGAGIIDAAGNRTAQYDEVTDINRSLAAMGRYLAAARSTAVFHNGPLAPSAVPRPPRAPVYVPSGAPLVVGMFAVGDDAYAMVVNNDPRAATEADLEVASADGAVQILDLASGAFVPAAATPIDSTHATLHLSLAAGDGALLHLRGPVPEGAPGAEAFVGTVRGGQGTLNVADARFGGQALRPAGWDDCPEGYSLAGRSLTDDGFWLCTRDDLAGRTFHVGNVVGDQGSLHRVAGGTVTALGAAGWDSCPAGTVVGRRFDSNGFWLCME
jgi:hypothetical protein